MTEFLAFAGTTPHVFLIRMKLKVQKKFEDYLFCLLAENLLMLKGLPGYLLPLTFSWFE